MRLALHTGLAPLHELPPCRPAAAGVHAVPRCATLACCSRRRGVLHTDQTPLLAPACSIERSNLFEQLCGLLSKAAFPTREGPLPAAHLQSLDGILGILSYLAAGCTGVSDLGGLGVWAGWWHVRR